MRMSSTGIKYKKEQMYCEVEEYKNWTEKFTREVQIRLDQVE